MVAVSVVIPTYNGAAHLEETIESVRSQTLHDYEIVVSDDQSTDGTVALARGFGDARIHVVVRDQPDGAAGNWNNALSMATGRYVKLLPQDDTLVSDCLERQAAILDSHDSCIMVASRRDIIDAGGRLLLKSRGLRGLAAGPRSLDDVVKAVFRVGTNVLGEPGAVLFRRDRISGLSFLPSDGYAIDLGFYLRVLALGECYSDPQVGARFRLHPDSWTESLRFAHFADVARCMHALNRQHDLGLLALTRGLAAAGVTALARLAMLRVAAVRSAGR